MQVFKPSEEDQKILKPAAARLKVANTLLGTARKESEAAKGSLANWLKDKRSLDIETLPIGEIVSIEGVALIKINKQTKFDEAGFLIAEPTIHAQYKKDFPVRKFEPL